MTPSKWEDWTEALAYFYFAWFGTEEVPSALRDALLAAFGSDFKPQSVYPIDYEDGRTSVLALDDDAAILVGFEPPSTTVTTYHGSLAGGVYTELRDLDLEETDQIEGTFEHKRLESPIVVRFHSPQSTASGSLEELRLKVGQPQAYAIFERVRETLRGWAIQPGHPPSGRA
jgi:hypothetical protein